MQTDDLIAALADTVPPLRRHATGRRLAIGMLAGAIMALVLMAAELGFRTDLGAALHGRAFWMKWTYTMVLGIGAVAATLHLSRPDARPMRHAWLIAIPVALLAGIAIIEIAQAPPDARLAMWLGKSAARCPFYIFGLSIPIYAWMLWSFRRFAPTRLGAAGAAAGLASGASAAAIYCLHCPEASASFVLTWYTLGIALAVVAGWLTGPRLLRW